MKIQADFQLKFAENIIFEILFLNNRFGSINLLIIYFKYSC